MLTKTTVSAVRTLMHLASLPTGEVASPRRVAEAIGESPTYLAKVTRLLVRAGILRAERGVKGGVQLNRKPAEITLLAVVEACEGALQERHCRSRNEARACALHLAANEIHQAVTTVLERWTLAAMLENPSPGRRPATARPCLLTTRWNGGSQLMQLR